MSKTHQWFRKSFAAVIALAMLVAGCSGSGSQSGQPKQGEKVTLKIGYQKHPIQDQQVKWMQKWAEQNNVNLELAPLAYEVYVDKMSANLQAPKSEFDIIWHNDDWGQLWASRLEVLDDLPGMKKVDPYDLEPFLYQGKSTAAPFVLTASLFYYRTDLIKAEEWPKTWDEFVKLAARVQKDGKVKWGFASGMKYPHDWLTILWSLWSNDGDIFKPFGARTQEQLEKGNFTPAVTDENFIQMVQFWRDVIHTHKVAPPAMTGYTRTDADALFMQGESAITMQDSTVWGLYNDPAKSKVAGKVAVAPWPLGPKGTSLTGWADAWAWAIPKNADPKRKDAAKKLLDYLLSNEEIAIDVAKSTGGVPANKAARDKFKQQDKDFAAIAKATVDSPRRVHSAYYIPQWTEIHTRTVDSVIKAIASPEVDIKKEMQSLDAELRKIVKH